MDSKGGFYFISTVLDMQIDLPVEITPEIKLEKANDYQIKGIKKFLVEYKKPVIAYGRYLYELDDEFNHLPEKDWRYYIISYKGGDAIVEKLFAIADIIHPHLKKASINYYTTEDFGLGKIIGGQRDLISENSVKELFPDHSPRKFDHNNLSNLQSLFLKFNALDKEKYEGIIRAVVFNANLPRLPNLTDLTVLGLFVIIEMLLTHKPNNKEIGDSSNHQIKSKMAFLSPRFSNSLDYSVFGTQVSNDKVWKALYEYRSRIAHGEHIDFNNKELKVLKDRETAFNFLESATRILLAHAINEPDVVNGLKPI
jgi:hypothetical protein